MPKWLLPTVIGLGAGSLAAFVGFRLFSKKLDEQLEEGGARMLELGEVKFQENIKTALDRELPPLIRREIDLKFAEYGITPTMGRTISALIATAERMGLMGLPRPRTGC